MTVRNWNIDGKCVKMEGVQTIREEEKLVQRTFENKSNMVNVGR